MCWNLSTETFRVAKNQLRYLLKARQATFAMFYVSACKLTKTMGKRILKWVSGQKQHHLAEAHS